MKINLISDTVTKPSHGMLEAMMSADVGDDVSPYLVVGDDHLFVVPSPEVGRHQVQGTDGARHTTRFHRIADVERAIE